MVLSVRCTPKLAVFPEKVTVWVTPVRLGMTTVIPLPFVVLSVTSFLIIYSVKQKL